jgi:hypothetical protein
MQPAAHAGADALAGLSMESLPPLIRMFWARQALQSSSSSRSTAGWFGFLSLSQWLDRLDDEREAGWIWALEYRRWSGRVPRYLAKSRGLDPLS